MHDKKHPRILAHKFRHQENSPHFQDMLHNLCFIFPQNAIYFIILAFPV